LKLLSKWLLNKNYLSIYRKTAVQMYSGLSFAKTSTHPNKPQNIRRIFERLYLGNKEKKTFL